MIGERRDGRNVFNLNWMDEKKYLFFFISEEVEIFSSHAQIHSFNLQYCIYEQERTRNVKNEGDEVRKFALILSFTISTKHLGLNLF
jgi:hypothetical protein